MNAKLIAIKNKTEEMKKPIAILVLMLFLDLLVFVGTFSLNGVFRPDILFVALYFSFYAYLFITDRKKDIIYLLLASLFSVVWTMLANQQYGYDSYMMNIFGLSAYPLFAWACGLSATFLLFRDIERLFFDNNKYFSQFFTFSLLYFIFLITLESIAYHVFGVRNSATSGFEGLPICDCIHAPLWMQWSYFVIGPLYFITAKYIGSKFEL